MLPGLHNLAPRSDRLFSQKHLNLASESNAACNEVGVTNNTLGNVRTHKVYSDLYYLKEK